MEWFALGSDILRDLRTRAFATELGVKRPQAVGHLVGVYGLLARQRDPLGQVSSIPDDVLEEEAMWEGKRGRFAAIFRKHYQDPDGTLRRWNVWNGANIARATRSRERIRKYRARQHEERNATQDVTRTEREPNALRSAEQYSTVQNSTVLPTATTPDAVAPAESPVAPPEPPPEPPAPPPAEEKPRPYPADVAAIGNLWHLLVGGIAYGRVATDCKPLVRTWGLEAVLTAVRHFAAHRARQVAAGNPRPDAWPQFVARFRDHLPPDVTPLEDAA